MSCLRILSLVLLLSALAVAQVTVIRGTAGNWTPGVYAVPFVPLVTTPSATLATVSPSAVGAGNATFGNVVGATNATLSNEFIAPPPIGVNTVPLFYGMVATPAETLEAPTRPFDMGISIQRPGIAQLTAAAGPARKASRTYTNEDIERIRQSNNAVKYRDKTEQF
jgi:hypothetical protein